jgi:hypothetical protein
MSQLAFRDALKNVSNFNIDSQYTYQLGLQVFNENTQVRDQNLEAYKEMCENLKKICNDLQMELEAIKISIPQL